jgi:hypothetical protein
MEDFWQSNREVDFLLTAHAPFIKAQQAAIDSLYLRTSALSLVPRTWYYPGGWQAAWEENKRLRETLRKMEYKGAEHLAADL